MKQSQTAMRTLLGQCCSNQNLYVSLVVDKHSIMLLNNTELIFLALYFYTNTEDSMENCLLLKYYLPSQNVLKTILKWF